MSKEETLVRIPENWGSVAEAMQRSGYSRPQVHEIANDGKIDSEFVTKSFRLVDIDQLLEYARSQGRELPGDE